MKNASIRRNAYEKSILGKTASKKLCILEEMQRINNIKGKAIEGWISSKH